MGEIQRRNGEIKKTETSPPPQREPDMRHVNSGITGKDSTHINVADATLLRQVSAFGHFESVNYQSERARDVSIAPDGTRTVTHRVTTKLATTHYDEKTPIELRTGLTDSQKAALVPIGIIVSVFLFSLVIALIIAVANTTHP